MAWDQQLASFPAIHNSEAFGYSSASVLQWSAPNDQTDANPRDIARSALRVADNEQFEGSIYLSETFPDQRIHKTDTAIGLGIFAEKESGVQKMVKN